VIELGFDFDAMAGPCELRLQGRDEALLHRAAREAMNEVRRIESKYSRYDEASIVSRINAAAGSGKAIEVDDETASLLDFATRLHALSDGLFDITSGVLRRAWNFRVARLPSRREIDELLPLIGWPKVQRAGRRIELPRAGMEIDFGGLGKEYAADRAVEVMLAAGMAHGFVNLGGDIRVAGPRAGGSGWRFGIRHPRRADALIRTVELASGALATSGDYERYFEIDSRRYCHLLDPRTGWPVDHWQSVSVIAPTCAAAGAACTIAALRQQDGEAFLRSERLPFVLVDRDGNLVEDRGGIIEDPDAGAA
jgi:thiamine biosynthesis lipoprotein